MVKCPKCGAEVVGPKKSWQIAPKGRKPIRIGVFKCTNCGTSFYRKVGE